MAGGWRLALLVALDSRRADLYVQLFAERSRDAAGRARRDPAGPARILCRRADRRRGAADRRRCGRACRRSGARPDRPVGVDPRLGARRARRRRCGAVGLLAARRGGRAGAAALSAPAGRDAAEGEKSRRPARRAMSPRIAPLPAGAAEPLALMHAACFPEDPWDAAAFAQLLALYGVFGYLAWLTATRSPAGFVIGARSRRRSRDPDPRRPARDAAARHRPGAARRGHGGGRRGGASARSCSKSRPTTRRRAVSMARRALSGSARGRATIAGTERRSTR